MLLFCDHIYNMLLFIYVNTVWERTFHSYVGTHVILYVGNTSSSLSLGILHELL